MQQKYILVIDTADTTVLYSSRYKCSLYSDMLPCRQGHLSSWLFKQF